MTAQHVSEGAVLLELACPRCGRVIPFAALLSARLIIPSDEVATLQPRLRSKAVTHLCDQPSLFDPADVDEVTGE